VSSTFPGLTLISWRNIKPVGGRDPGPGEYWGILGGPIQNIGGEAPNISLYLAPRIPPRFPSPGCLPPTRCTFLQLVKMRLQELRVKALELKAPTPGGCGGRFVSWALCLRVVRPLLLCYIRGYLMLQVSLLLLLLLLLLLPH